MFNTKLISSATLNYMSFFLNNNNEANYCLKKIEEIGSLILFGGAIRDIITNKIPRDYDIVVNTDNDTLEKIVQGYEFKKNRFGGFNVTLDGHKFDMWSLENTWAFKNNIVHRNINNLTDTVFFNADSIAVNLTTGEAYAQKFIQAFESNHLDIVLYQNPFPALCVLRAFVFKYKLHFNFSKSLQEYIKVWVSAVDSPINSLLEIQNKHYGSIMLDKSYLSEQLCEVV